MPKSPDKPLDMKDKRVERALALAFEGRWTQAEIAKNCDVSPRTVWTWLQDIDFQSALEAKRADFAASIREVTYADKARRIVALDAMAESARREYEQRTYLIEERPTKDGVATSENYNRDAFECFRGALDDIAKELGQRKAEKPDSDASQVRIIIETDVANVALVQVSTDNASEQ